jgi:hypothetical protein
MAAGMTKSEQKMFTPLFPYIVMFTGQPDVSFFSFCEHVNINWGVREGGLLSVYSDERFE